MPWLILIKHSAPEILAGIPANQWKLSEIGKLRCATLAEKIAQYSPDVVISSVEPKAIETAQIVAEHIHQPFYTFENLHEHDRTGIDFLSKDQFETSVEAFFKFPEKPVMGKETALQARERFSKAIRSLEAAHRNQNTAIIAHGTVITLLVAQIVGLEPFSFWKKLGLPSFVVFSLPEWKLVTIEESILE